MGMHNGRPGCTDLVLWPLSALKYEELCHSAMATVDGAQGELSLPFSWVPTGSMSHDRANHASGKQRRAAEATSNFLMQRLEVFRFIAFWFVLVSHVLLSDNPPSHLSR
jgi:hypothetical protein